MLSSPPASKLASLLGGKFHDYWGWFLAEGVVLGFLGVGAVFLPGIAGVATTIFLGWLFLMVGAIGLMATFRARHAPGFGWSLLSAVLALIVGGLLLWNPLRGLLTLTFVLVAYFIMDGVFSIFLSIAHRRELSGKWEWMLVNGIVDLILAAIVISGLPGTAVWLLGLLVGIDLIFAGASLVAMALAARKPTG